MKKLFFFISIFVATSCIFTSCQDSKKEKQILQIEQLIKTTDSIRTVFDENRNDSLMSYITRVMDVEFRIRRCFNSDTVSYELGKKINDYKQIRKKLKPLLKNNKQMIKGTEEEKKCLNQLKSDVVNGVGDRSNYNEYIFFEKNKINQLNLILEQIITTQKSQIEVFNRLHDEMNIFSLTLLKNCK